MPSWVKISFLFILLVVVTGLFWELLRTRRRADWYLNALEFAGGGVWAWNISRDRWYWSDKVFEIRDFPKDSRNSVPSDQEFYSRIHPEDRLEVQTAERSCLLGQKSYYLEYRTLMRDGSIRWLRNRGDITRDRKGRAIHMMGFVLDVTEERMATRELEQRSLRDGLTGLPNRLGLSAHLGNGSGKAVRDGTRTVMAFIDLNGFKAINDRLGHDAGDGVLVDVARVLEFAFQFPDFVSRIGGDEFVVVVECRQDELSSCMKRVRDTLEHAFVHDIGGGVDLKVGAAVGIVHDSVEEAFADDLLRRADQAMYRAKVTGALVAFDPP